MSTAAERLAEKAARLKNKPAPAAPAGVPVPGVHTKQIRNTVDLSPTDHAALRAWCGETAVMLGRSRVTTQDVLRAMVARLLTDDQLSRAIQADISAPEQR
jgi:hypothetical protein